MMRPDPAIWGKVRYPSLFWLPSRAYSNGVVNGQNYRTVRDRILPFSKIVVNSLGHGNFSTIQSAIDSVSSNNKYWVLINVEAGIYREKVTIPSDKPYIILKGSGKMRTWVEWDDHNTTAQSPTFQSNADNIVRCGINVIGRALGEGFVGYITAQGRENPKDSNGFVFKNCNVFGDGSTFLGRPWRPYARVLFYNTSMANIIQPAGWDPWDSSQHE
ncbi:putative pectinesterase [Arachis hypogaea]|nr:putative pectinesterase [Arachis hypogaea]